MAGRPRPKPVQALPRKKPRARDWLFVGDFDLAPGQEIVAQRRTLANDPLWKRIAFEVGQAHGVSIREMLSLRRDKVITRARQEAIWRVKNETAMSLPAIGRRFNRDHTTVIYSVRKYEERMRAAQQ
jgi:chromosomal replication initiation ATPase DnaA